MTTGGVGEWFPGDDPVTEIAETIGGDLDLSPTPSVGSDPPALRFLTVDEFVQEFLLEMLWSDVETSSKIWCPQWWKHPAAIVRLEALHRSFEQLRQDPATGISMWLRDHADYHMSVLLDPNGPFRGCSTSKGHDGRRPRSIESEAAPDGLFATED